MISLFLLHIFLISLSVYLSSCVVLQSLTSTNTFTCFIQRNLTTVSRHSPAGAVTMATWLTSCMAVPSDPRRVDLWPESHQRRRGGVRIVALA